VVQLLKKSAGLTNGRPQTDLLCLTYRIVIDLCFHHSIVTHFPPLSLRVKACTPAPCCTTFEIFSTVSYEPRLAELTRRWPDVSKIISRGFVKPVATKSHLISTCYRRRRHRGREGSIICAGGLCKSLSNRKILIPPFHSPW